MAAPTPGPWVVEETYDSSRTIAILRDFRPAIRVGLHVNALANWVGPSEVDRIFANARLIAAAPELLAALKTLLPLVTDARCQRSVKWTSVRAAARAHIAKAEGR